MAPESRSTLEVPASPEHLDAIFDLINTVAVASGVPTDTTIRFESAAMEVVDNIIEHGATGRPRHLSLTLTVDDGWFRGDVEDDGPPVAVDLQSVEMPDEMADHGRGLAMAARLLDEFEYRRHDDRNVWRLGVSLSGTGAPPRALGPG